MPRGLVFLGVSHSSAPIERREQLALSPAQAGALASRVAARPDVDEALVLSTCERTELYALACDEAPALQELERLVGPLGPQEVEAGSGRGAVEHLMRVAAGLESVVLGEVEILGQVRRAGELARERHASAYVLGRLSQAALAAGRRARDETEIARGRASLSSAAVDLACRLAPALPRGTALVLGSGETGSSVARTLRSEGFEVKVAARHRSERAGRLSREIGGSLVDLEEQLFDALVQADVVISCTGAPHRLVPSEALIEVAERRAGRELLVLDLAMPRDFDPAARSVEGVRLYDLEDLREVAGATAIRRRSALRAAESIVSEEAERFCRWMSALDAVPTIKDLHSYSREAVLKALRRTDLATGAEEEVLRAASETIAAGLLHRPTARLRAAAERGDVEGLTPSVRQLFALDTDGH
jgi:glutamyl-tRNA reductase